MPSFTECAGKCSNLSTIINLNYLEFHAIATGYRVCQSRAKSAPQDICLSGLLSRVAHFYIYSPQSRSNLMAPSLGKAGALAASRRQMQQIPRDSHRLRALRAGLCLTPPDAFAQSPFMSLYYHLAGVFPLFGHL